MSSGLSRVETQKKRRLEEKKKSLLNLGTTKGRDSNRLENNKRMNNLERITKGEVSDTQNDHIPSRSDTYSSYHARVSKIFINTLITLFIMLTVALLVWGVKGAPPLKEIW